MKKWKKLAEWGKARWQRVIVWAEWCAEIWATYWLLITGVCLVLGSVVLKWIEFPISGNRTGLQLSLLRNAELFPHFHLFSFGVLGIIVLIIGVLLLAFSGRPLALAAALLITLSGVVPCQIAFQQPALLRQLADEDLEFGLVKDFTTNYLPKNLGASENIPKQLILYTAWGRFLGALSFLRLGWYCFAGGSLLVAVYSIYSSPNKRLRQAAPIIYLPAGALLVLLSLPLLGQYYYTRASVAKASGDNEKAIADYRKAISLDHWHAEDIDLYATMGDLERQASLAGNSPERHISRAMELKAADEYEPAIFELALAAEAGGPLAAAVRRESARTRGDLALALYRAGSVGGAITNWEKALAEDPSQVYLLPYLARANFDIGRYQVCIDVLTRWIKIVADHTSLLADAYSLAGDASAKLGRMAQANRYYNLALSADNILNHWAITGLIGD